MPDLELVLLSRLRLHGSTLYGTLSTRHRVRWFGWQYPRALTALNLIPYMVWEFAFLLTLSRRAKRGNAPVIVVHFVSLDAVVAVLFRRVYRSKLVLYGIGSDVLAPRSSLHQRFLKWVLTRADHVFCANTEIKNRLAQLGRRDCFVLPTPFVGEPSPTEERPKVFDVVSIGNLVPEKEHEVLIRSLACVGRPTKTAIVGDGQLMSHLRKIGSEQEGCSVQFFGQVPHDRVWQILGESRVYVHTSRREGIPASVLEAIWCELPIVAVQGPYLKDMTEIYGFRITVVPADSIQLLGAAIGDVLSNYASRKSEATTNKERLLRYQMNWEDRFEKGLKGNTT